MATKASTFTKWATTSVTGETAGDVIVNDYFVDLKAADVVLNDVIDLGILPGNHTVVDAILIADDIDTGAEPTVALDVGIMSGVPGDETSVRTCGNEFFAADTTARAGGVTRMSKKDGFLVKPTVADRSIGVKFQAAAATAAAGRVRVRVMMAPATPEVQF
jgi:hypothetical protein